MCNNTINGKITKQITLNISLIQDGVTLTCFCYEINVLMVNFVIFDEVLQRF